MKRVKTKYDELRGVSAKLPENDLVRFKDRMVMIKAKHGAGFSVADLLLAITSMPFEILDAAVGNYVTSKDINLKVISKLDISDDAKARIEAILAEEAQKRG
jgi:hypothetical protein